jgi:ribosomal-protein-alanine N-acetyltransferase
LADVRSADPLNDGVIRLRAWDVADAPWYAEVAANDPEIQRFTSESPDTTADQVRAAIEQLLAGPPQAAGFVITDAVTGERLGNIALEIEAGVGHMSYWLAAPARGRGAATIALKLFSAWAFGHLGLAELRLWAHADNTPSRAVAERAGYNRDPDHDEIKQIKGEPWPGVAYVMRMRDVIADR